MLFRQGFKTSSVLRRYTHSYAQIPGPVAIPILGHSYIFSPLGTYKHNELTKALADLASKYGKIFKLKLGTEIVVVNDAEGSLKIFQHEGKFPARPTFEALKHFREKEFGCVGLVPDNGPNWYRLRQFVAPMLQLKFIQQYWPRQAVIAEDFAQYLGNTARNGVIDDFLKQAFLYALESVSIFCYGTRIGCFSTKADHCNRVTKVNEDFLEVLGPSMFEAPLWKYFPTKTYRRIVDSQRFMTEIAIEHLNEAKLQMEKDREKFAESEPFLHHLLSNPNIKNNEIIVLLTEIFQGGIDATATTISMMLYYLAQNSSIQEELFEKLHETPLAPGLYPPLLRACLRETMRLFPTASANSRILNSDAVICDYEVPKGTLVISLNPLMCRDEKYFKNGKKFVPGRWLQQSDEQINPYVSLPFGHGARMCPGRRLAEQEIMLVVAKIVQRFRFTCLTEGEIGEVMKTNLVPDKPLNFRFTPRNKDTVNPQV